MTVIAAAGLGGFLWVLVVLACPLMMIFMMRGMHGHGRAGHGHDASSGDGCHGGASREPGGSRATKSLDELKRERDELNALIAERAEQEVASR